ncbi:MAG: hypothetical protein HY819_17930 [Acidobacteria bacterium]|nr:hypothetical protein [Acidobacteriota bacterium]
MLQVRLASFVLKLLFVFIAICFVFSIPNEVLAQCLPPEATVLEGNGDFAFTAIVQGFI